MKKKLLLSVFTMGLFGNYIYAVDVQNLIQAINDRDGDRFFSLLQGNNDFEKPYGALFVEPYSNDFEEEDSNDQSLGYDSLVGTIQALVDSGVNLQVNFNVNHPYTGKSISVPLLDSLLWQIVWDGDVLAAELLLKNGANINYVEPVDNSTPLKIAQENNDKPMIDLLLAYGQK